MNIKLKKKFLTTACLVFLCASAWGQEQVKVSGRVVDPSGAAVPSAVVKVEGTSNGTITDNDGNYTISVPVGAELSFSHGEYGEKSVKVGDGVAVYNVTLGQVIAPAPQAVAQPENVALSGVVVNEQGEPMPGVSVIVEGSTSGTITDNEGNYSIKVPADSKVKYSFMGYETEKRKISSASPTVNVTLRSLKSGDSEEDFLSQKIDNGALKSFSRRETTSAASKIGSTETDRRLAKSINNSILGRGNGLTSLDAAGKCYSANPAFYLRGLHTLNDNNSPLIVVDGIERDITTISPGEVESVTLLKDAISTALYGYKATNGVILVTTKRGKPEASEINVKYEHAFNKLVDSPEFVDAYEFATAVNEGATAEGLNAPYNELALEAYKNGLYPEYFPNVNWREATFSRHAHSNRYAIDFTGGGKRFRYYTYLNLFSDKGHVNPDDWNDGYTTQDFYSRGNLRSNLDIDMTDHTLLKVNIGGILSEVNMPGNQAGLWGLVYSLPANAFPIKNSKGDWGGTSDNPGTINPVAQAAGAGYYKIHERGLQADLQINQSLGMFVEGLGFSARMGYDNYSTLYENHSKTFVYGSYPISWNTNKTGWESLVVGSYDTFESTASELGTAANTNYFGRRATINASINYDRQLNDDNYLYAQVKWDFENSDFTGANTTIYRQNFSWFSHYGFRSKYFLDLALVGSESSRLAPDSKWDFSPNVGVAWVVSEEDFLSDNDIVNFLKVRASFGKQNADYLPPSGSWFYWKAGYNKDSGGMYSFNDSYQAGSYEFKSLAAPVEELTHEQAYKINVGLDARLFGGLDVEFDWFKQTNKQIWVDGSGVYTAVFGFSVPYVNNGEVESSGVELSLDYKKQLGEVAFNIGGNISYNHSKVIDMAEEPRLYSNLVETGDPLKSTRGLIAEGLFQNQEEIDNSPQQTFSTVKPGDIKYKDVNGDGIIDASDKVRFGYSTTLPEIFYNFDLGVEFKGIGLNAMFQGVGRYTAIKNTAGYYWGLTTGTAKIQNISKEVYNDHWTAENPNAKYPRMAYQSNANNYQTSTFWEEDRSFLKLRDLEVYYKFPKSMIENTFIEGAKVYVRGVDLFTIDHMENVDAASYGATQPLTRKIIAGFALSF